ncbi:ArsR family transcriptional regulator [Candidatus Bathyarchaeota archaeon]|nr:winged helix-turn-helix transcriptional regulator [Candidatus Bathyarchaeota archaeon]PDM26061.1 MAG: ArsR family transcriptional regulator [Candidatus Bathyarchaeota archaeon B24-2]RJS81399.1 MAG: ArsR family transcriptional regulator [Candidatus Bathyarchaeota archaeon]RLI21819.1 MAG: ArsR family transcriptional regulator [Candidatus Bathyarchaeota archaeon]HDM45053.1 ArsR family transcriptional regulator [Candidatus Bathyarchaeota archaeon]
MRSESREETKPLVEYSSCLELKREYAEDLRGLAEKISDEGEEDFLYRVFKALADRTRIRMLKLLDGRELSVCEIMIALQLTQPTTSHHLGILESAKLVKKRKKGKWSFYSLASSKLIGLIEELSASLRLNQ